MSKYTLPQDSLLNKYSADFIDIFDYTVELEPRINPDDVQLNFWAYQPKWLQFLFKLRNILVKPFGLQSGDGDVSKFEEIIRNGGSYKFSQVEKNEHENVLCLKDSHLYAYISVYATNENNKQKISAITLVQFKNKLGHVYFFFIKPFHKVIVKRVLKHAVDKAGYDTQRKV